MTKHPRPDPRPGVAAVEFAVILPLILLLLLGTWEVGRLVQVYAILYNATREGARVAAQGQIINLTGAYTQIKVSSGSPDVYDTVKNYLTNSGINAAGLDVDFTFLSGSGSPVSSPAEPYQGTRAMRFRVTATLPYNSFRWTQLSLLNVASIQTTVDWVSLLDDPFSVNTSMPSWSPYP